MQDSPNRLNRIEAAIERLIQMQTNVVQTQEQHQQRLDRHEQTIERILGHVNNLYESVQTMQLEIKGLRTESLRIQRRIFGDDVE